MNKNLIFKSQSTPTIKVYLYIFVYFMFVRLIYVFFQGFFNNYTLLMDSVGLVHFADQALLGDFNFDWGRFIASPLMSLFIAGHKLIFGSYWNVMLITSQLILSSVSGIYIYKITRLLFEKQEIAMIATIIYGLFPMTLYWVHTFSQETLFQSLLIFSIYHLIQYCSSVKLTSLIYSAVLFALSFLTKSHILIFSLFIPVILFLNINSKKKSIFSILGFTLICILSTLPYGLYHLKYNQTYILSSNGYGYQFYFGNSWPGYRNIVGPLPQDTILQHYKNGVDNAPYYYGSEQANIDSMFQLPQHTKQFAFLKSGLNWIITHPWLTLKLKCFDFFYFLIPGVNPKLYTFWNWFISFIISIPIYIFGYWGMWLAIKKDYKKHFFMVALFLTMILFSVVWYVQNRFRTITIEPFYIIYASSIIYMILSKTRYLNFIIPDNNLQNNS